jgi:hypothetical protein
VEMATSRRQRSATRETRKPAREQAFCPFPLSRGRRAERRATTLRRMHIERIDRHRRGGRHTRGHIKA